MNLNGSTYLLRGATTAMHRVIGAIDHETRCSHYHNEEDIIAIKLKCCGTYYGCYFCHEEAANHKSVVWAREEWHTKEVLCGKCGAELTIEEYLHSNYTCLACNANFNPKCRNHYRYYFEWTVGDEIEQI